MMPRSSFSSFIGTKVAVSATMFVRTTLFFFSIYAIFVACDKEVTAKMLAEKPHLSGIFGKDDRKILETEDKQWAAIGRVNRSVGGFCTGTLVGPRIVVTAAHCLYNPRTRRRLPASSLHFVAGYARGTYVAHRTVREAFVPETYAWGGKPDPQHVESDWALLVLDEPLAAPPMPVWRRDLPKGVVELKNLEVALAGYAQDRAHLLSIHDGCRITDAFRGHALFHTCDTTWGGSGSPLLVREGETLKIIGITSGAIDRDGASSGVAISVLSFSDALDALRCRWEPIDCAER